MRRFTRLTNAFSKKVENHAHAVAIHLMHYNFVRIHQTLRCTPAMAAGVTTKLWELSDMVWKKFWKNGKTIRRANQTDPLPMSNCSSSTATLRPPPGRRAAACGGALHSASYDRKPRGCPAGLGQEYAQRFSFCCAVDGCRKRTTPPSLRFLGRKVYLATVVTLISAMLLGTTPARLARLSIVPGIDRRTLARWRAWWRSTFTDGPFARSPGPRCDAANRHRRPAGLAARPLCRRHRASSSPPCCGSSGPLTGGASAMRAF